MQRNKIESFFRLVLGLSFLPERMRRWLFDKGGRVKEDEIKIRVRES